MARKLSLEPTDGLICLSCRHYLEVDKRTRRPRCLAFLDGIPDEIIDGKNDHSKPLEDQENDLVYAEIE
jgi:hypothetical protein